jgi:hypothetical protein
MFGRLPRQIQPCPFCWSGIQESILLGTMPEPQLAVIADDLTGASDAAIAFVLAGLNTMVSLGSQVHPRADVLAIATHSRNLTGDEAARLSAQAGSTRRLIRLCAAILVPSLLQSWAFWALSVRW